MKEDIQGSDDNAIALRQSVEAGTIKPADLSRPQVDGILAAIEADDVAGVEMSDRTISIYSDLCDRISGMEQAAQLARQLSRDFNESQGNLLGAMNGLAQTVQDHHQFNRQMSGDLGRVAGAANFRGFGSEFVERIDEIKQRHGMGAASAG